MHAVQQLYQYRKSISTREFLGRGYKVDRCVNCRIAKKFCICQYKPQCHSNAAFLLLMYDDEVLKPSNTGRLIADLIDDTHAVIWSRTETSPQLQQLLDDPQWQPFVVFPQVYAEPQQQVINQVPDLIVGKKPLFILLDGTWREAKKMFRKSPYLAKFPVLSIDLSQQADLQQSEPRFRVRKQVTDGQMATAEVAARVLASFGEADNAHLLDLWFDLFSHHYQKGASDRVKGQEDALAKLQEFRSK